MIPSTTERVFDIINLVVICFVSLGFVQQILFLLLSFLKGKSYKKAKVEHKACVLLPARNEGIVIGNIIESIKKSNYSKDKYDIVVIAHNCTDNTAELAKKHGARVIEINRPDEKTKGWALKRGTDVILAEENDYEFFLVFDADNLVSADFMSIMNDAFESGVHLGRGFDNCKNFFDNVLTGVGGFTYLRDSRLNAQVRESLHLNSMVLGPGCMISKEFLVKEGGYSFTSLVEDAQMTTYAIRHNWKTHYVKDAEFFVEQSTSLKEQNRRNMRLGRGLNKLYFKEGPKLLWKFFKTLDPSYLDMLLTLQFIPVSIISTLWFPLYYIAIILKAIIVGSHGIWHMFAFVPFDDFAKFVVLFLIFGFYGVFILQPILTYLGERHRMPKVKFRKYLPSILLYPFFMLLYSICITAGALNPKIVWLPVERIKAISIDELYSQEEFKNNENIKPKKIDNKKE